MSKKKAFVLRLHPEVMKKLEKWAADEFRSVNGQLEWIIDRALRETGRLNQAVSSEDETDQTINSDN
ncbi:MAG TPA: Arc family DNA binding domain-containing protein [Saprospirales bacterium]|nr:Arc family DNA binding domain-containing protein [Saprospirales bacterium]HAY71046.1 Arc family DNA binding domain-containing protein [Saprospirales bacterium]